MVHYGSKRSFSQSARRIVLAYHACPPKPNKNHRVKRERSRAHVGTPAEPSGCGLGDAPGRRRVPRRATLQGTLTGPAPTRSAELLSRRSCGKAVAGERAAAADSAAVATVAETTPRHARSRTYNPRACTRQLARTPWTR